MTKSIELPKETQGKHYEVDSRNIEVLNRAGGNIRTDYGNLNELADSIAQNGVIVPLRAFRSKDDPEKWIAIDGHRRLAACKILSDKGTFIRVKVISTDARKLSDEQLIYEMVITNEGKELNPVELSEAIRRLISYGHKPKEISERLGKPVSLIKNLEAFATSPKRLRDMVVNGQIGYSTILKVMKKEPDFSKVIDTIEKAEVIAKTKSSGELKKGTESIKITKLHIDKANNKLDSFKELIRVVNSQESNPKEIKQLEFYKMLRKITSNKVTKSDIEQFLFN